MWMFLYFCVFRTAAKYSQYLISTYYCLKSCLALSGKIPAKSLVLLAILIVKKK